MAEFGPEFQEGKEQVHDQGDPDLREHRIEGRAEECFDFEVLLDPLEKDLDLPTGLVSIGDGLGGQVEVVGHESIGMVAFVVMPGDQAQVAGIALA